MIHPGFHGPAGLESAGTGKEGFDAQIASSRREDFTSGDDLVFANVLGRALDDSALRRRYRRAQDAAGVRPLRFHDLRHTFGSLLAAGGVDVVTIKAAMGHSALATTARYLHARPAVEQAQVFTRAFEGATAAREEVAGAEGTLRASRA